MVSPFSHPVRVVFARTTLLSFLSSWRAAALALTDIGGAAFFASSAALSLGLAAPWFVLAAVLIGFAVRAVDLEACALFIPGGVHGSVKEALGRRAATLAASALLVEHLFLGALSASVAGHYLVTLVERVAGGERLQREISANELSGTLAVCLIGVFWWRQRQGRSLPTRSVVRAISVVVVVLAAVIGGTALLHAPGAWRNALRAAPVSWTPVALLTGVGYGLFAVGSVETLAHVAAEVQPPRIRHLRRTGWLLGAYTVVFTALGAFLVAMLVPADVPRARLDAPLAVLTAFMRAPGWMQAALALGATLAAVVLLGATAQRALVRVQHVLWRLSLDGVLARSMRQPDPQLGTPLRLIDLSAAVQVLIVLASAGRVSWLARAYAAGVVACALLQIVALIRLRARRGEPRAYRVPLNIRVGRRELPIGLWLTAAVLVVPAALLVAGGDGPFLAGTALLGTLAIVLTARAPASGEVPQDAPLADDFQLLTARDVSLQVDVRPGSLLVPVRRPHFLAHLAAALRAAGDRDVVVMTVRTGTIEVPDDASPRPRTTEYERQLFTAVLAIAERYGRAVHLLIVPGSDVFEAVVDTVVRLRASDVYVGESETLTADDQARLLGEAWERTSKPDALDVRLVIHHASGRTALYHLGAHPPTLSPDDLHLIHSLWLDAVKAVGPHVHHRDIVRAALTHMDEQLHAEGPSRDTALESIRQAARPADELAALVRQRDFARLRDMIRNRPPGDIAAMLVDLTLEDQAVIFRVLPRKTAAATFEYLSRDAQRALLRGLAQEDVAALLNNMAPDERTMFLEELPASVTQQLLALLTPEERTVAVTLLGYPEGSIGRLMTPDYIAVREHWTVQQVLDYVREHGHDSETLNVIYVVDEHGVLIDDIRIREFLLTSPARAVADLMDRRFVALNAAEDQHSAVAVFRGEDRSALPVTDSAGVLIGIVTVDDVLDVAEAAATEEIQRFGGSEALDEPYTQIPFGRMIQKRAGWLTALFLGEMLTATAMGFFEHEIERAVVLALFVPLIISSGGNSGSQASTLVIRAIALGELKLEDWWRVMRREISAGLVLGGILGSIGFLRITIWSAFSPLYGPHWVLVALTVAAALVGVVMWGTLVGSLLPFLLRRLGFDPATSSAPFVATLVDVTGLVIYFTVGLVMLRGTLL